MKPGRELDALVAEKVMGYHRKNIAGSTFWVNQDGDEPDHGNDYSSNISAAWEVVEKFDNYTLKYHPNEKIHVCLLSDYSKDSWGKGEAETAPNAICIAALQACGVDIE